MFWRPSAGAATSLGVSQIEISLAAPPPRENPARNNHASYTSYPYNHSQTSFRKKKELVQLADLDLNPPIEHAGLVSVRLPVRLGKLNKALVNGYLGQGTL